MNERIIITLRGRQEFHTACLNWKSGLNKSRCLSVVSGIAGQDVCSSSIYGMILSIFQNISKMKSANTLVTTKCTVPNGTKILN